MTKQSQDPYLTAARIYCEKMGIDPKKTYAMFDSKAQKLYPAGLTELEKQANELRYRHAQIAALAEAGLIHLPMEERGCNCGYATGTAEAIRVGHWPLCPMYY